ncbi:hypothetical protein N665_0104s0060 [Sinapis alba]|nr:hypothetical protein N665_0104s0060 [Sinapis alba]
MKRGFLLKSNVSSKTTTPKEKPPSEPPFLMTSSLPHDILVSILARVSRSHYPNLSLVSKHFRSIVRSREIYARRSSLGCTEHCLYVVLYNLTTKEDRCYLLLPTTNGSQPRLVLVPSLPAIPNRPYPSSYVAVGSKIYIFCRSNDSNTTLRIDCESHTVQPPLPSMPEPLSFTVADVIEGRIYVIGRHHREIDKMMVVVFNTETQTWEPEKTTCDVEAGDTYHGSVVMGDKMYTKDFDSTFVYEPKERKWETDEVMNGKEWRYGCVVDDVLYYYECEEEDEERDQLRAFHRKEKCWRVVKGLESLLRETRNSLWLQTESYGGKLALFFPKGGRRSEVWCAEISLERRQGGEIWGKVEWCNHLVTGFQFTKSLDVVV